MSGGSAYGTWRASSVPQRNRLLSGGTAARDPTSAIAAAAFLPYGATGHELLGTHYFSAKTRTRDRICDAMTAAKCMARVSLEVNVPDIMLPPGYGFS